MSKAMGMSPVLRPTKLLNQILPNCPVDSRRLRRSRTLCSTAAKSAGHEPEPPRDHQRPASQQGEEDPIRTFVIKNREAPRLTFAEAARTLVDGSVTGVLATHSSKGSDEGFPLSSVVEYVADSKGRPIFGISMLAKHTASLYRDGRCSLLVPENKSIALSDSRALLIGTVRAYDKEDAGDLREAYLAKMPQAFWVDFGDFRWFRMDDIVKATYAEDVRRNARTGKATAEEYLAASPDPVAQYRDSICSDLNKSATGGPVSAIIAKETTGLDVTNAEAYRVDSLGFDAMCTFSGRGPVNIRLPFPRRATTREDVEQMVEEMMGDAAVQTV